MDITYCSYLGCENRENCTLHQDHAKAGERISISPMKDCKYYKDMLRKLAKEDEEEAWAEALRESHMLDDNENSLSYRNRL